MKPGLNSIQSPTQRQRILSTIVEHERFLSAVSELEDVMSAQLEESVSQGMCLMGSTGTGKSQSVKILLERYPSYQTEEVTIMPVLKVIMPTTGGVKPLYELILAAMGAPTTGTAATLERRIQRLFKLCGVKLVIVDESQHMVNMNGRTTAQKKAADSVKNLMELTGVSVVLVGTEDLFNLLTQDSQLRRRFSKKVTLLTWNPNNPKHRTEVGKVLFSLLSRAGVQVDFEGLKDVGFITRFTYATGGRMAYIVKLLVEALLLVEKSGATTLDRKHFHEAFTRVIWHKATEKTNPFDEEFEMRILNGKDEPFAEDL